MGVSPRSAARARSTGPGSATRSLAQRPPSTLEPSTPSSRKRQARQATCSSNGGDLVGAAAVAAVTRLSSSPWAAGHGSHRRLAAGLSGAATTPSRSTSLTPGRQPPSTAEPCR
jgi:hypothetical protein